MRRLLAGLALLAAGCNPEQHVTLVPTPASCALAGAVDRLVVTALGDLPPAPSLTAQLPPRGKLSLGPLGVAVHVITLAAIDAGGATVGIGATAPFTFGTIIDPALPIAWAAPDTPCPVAAMRAPRWGHRATLVGDGSVLFSGGSGVDGPVTQVELYDPPSANFVAASSLPADFSVGHTATLLADGSLLLAGGASVGGAGNSGSLLLSPDGLTSASTVGPLAIGRAFHGAVRLTDGRLMVSGGCGRVVGGACEAGALLAGTEIYDPANGTWREGPKLVRARSHHQALLRGDGEVLLLGGRGENGAANDAELIDLTAAHATGATIPAGGSAALDTGAVVVAGGELAASAQVSFLGLPASAPVVVGALSEARARPTVTLFPDGDLLVIGGLTVGGRASGATDLVSALGTVSALPAGAPRVDHSATLLLDGSLLVAGGRDDFGAPRGDGEIWIHSLTGVYSNLPAQSFSDAASSQILIRRPDHVKVAGGRLSLAAAAGDGGRPGELALLRGMIVASVDVSVALGRGAGGAGAAVILGWASDGNYRFVAFVPGQPVTLMRVDAADPTANLVATDARCVGAAPSAAQFPLGDVAPVRVSVAAGSLRVYAGGVRLLDCAPTDDLPRGRIGVGTLGGEALFDDLSATRN